MQRSSLGLIALVLALSVACSASPGGPPAAASSEELASAPEALPESELEPDLDMELEWDRELPAGMSVGSSWVDDTTHRPVRVVDAITGRAVPGALVDNWWEADTPHAEDWEGGHELSLVADRDGWVLTRAEGRGNWWCVQADGYAPAAENSFREEFLLEAGEDVVLEVRDWRDLPVVGVLAEHPFGCGHTATVRSGITDARGRLTLPSVEPYRTDVWLRGDGVAGRNPAYASVERTPVDDGVHIIRATPSPVIEGVVLDHRGEPAAHAVVGTREAHRGPWVRADERGRFRLVGALPWSVLTVYHWPPRGSPRDTPYAEMLVQTVPGVEHTIRLPVPFRDLRAGYGEEPRLVLERGPLALEVRFESEDARGVAGTTRVVAVRVGDGLAVVRTASFRDGRGSLVVPVHAGDWRVTVGSPAGAFQETTRRVVVADRSSASVDLTLQPNPVWVPRIFERGEDGSLERLVPETWEKLSVITAAGEEPATASATVERAIHVPASGPFAVHFAPDHATHWRDGHIVLEAPPVGDGPRIVIPEQPPSEPYRSPLPPPAEGALDGTSLTALGPDGSPVAGARVKVASTLSAEYAATRRYELDENGAAEVMLHPNDVVTVARVADDSLEPLVTRVTDVGPWVLRWPDTLVEIRATDETGAPLEEFAVSLGAESHVWGEAGIARLWRTTAGPLRLWVSASRRRCHDLRTIVRDGEHRVIHVMLRLDPAAIVDDDE